MEASLDYVFEPGETQVPIAEARGKLMASYIDMIRCKISDYGERTLNDASNERATRTFELFMELVGNWVSEGPHGVHQWPFQE